MVNPNKISSNGAAAEAADEAGDEDVAINEINLRPTEYQVTGIRLSRAPNLHNWNYSPANSCCAPTASP